MRLSLRFKFILLISAVLLVLFSLIAFFLVRNARSSLVNDINRETQAFASLATKPIGDTYDTYSQSGTVRIQQEVSRFTDLDKNVSNVTLVSVQGQVLSSQGSQPAKITMDEANTFDTITYRNKSGQIVRVIQPYIGDNGQHNFAVVYDISTQEVSQTITRQETDIAIFAAIGLIASAVVTYELLNQLFIRPIKLLSHQSGVISSGHYDQQVELDRTDEIGALATSVNHMATVLKANIEQLQAIDKLKSEFIMITSHNLRTPLTIIEGGVETLESSGLNEQSLTLVSTIESSAKQLNHFAEQMLTIASIEAGKQLKTDERTTLKEIIEPLRASYTSLAHSQKLAFSVNLQQADEPIIGNGQQLGLVVQNLLDNAFKFTKSGTVSVHARREGSEALISVQDSGIGIAANEMSKLFTKFHRGTDTLTYNYQGTGIGLYAAKLIVEQYGGHITVSSKLGHGATFTIHLPLLQKLN